MAISEAQLETWANQGATVTSTQTYTSVKTALDAIAWPANNQPEIYLQGSYRNDTNIRIESDVDVVVELASFRSDLSNFTAVERQAYEAAFPNATYLWEHGYPDTLAGLQRYFGNAAVREGNKAICVTTPYRTADVVVAIGYRKYSRFIAKTKPLCLAYRHGREMIDAGLLTFLSRTMTTQWQRMRLREHKADLSRRFESLRMRMGLWRRAVL